MSAESLPPRSLYDEAINCVGIPNPDQPIAVVALHDDNILRMSEGELQLKNNATFVWNSLVIMRQLRREPQLSGNLRDFGNGHIILPNTEKPELRQSTFNTTIKRLAKNLEEKSGEPIILHSGRNRGTRHALNPDVAIVDLRSVKPEPWTFDSPMRVIEDEPEDDDSSADSFRLLSKPRGDVVHHSSLRFVTLRGEKHIEPRFKPESEAQAAQPVELAEAKKNEAMNFDIVFGKHTFNITLTEAQFAKCSNEIRLLLAYSAVADKGLSPRELLNYLPKAVNRGAQKDKLLTTAEIISNHRSAVLIEKYITIDETTDNIRFNNSARTLLAGAGLVPAHDIKNGEPTRPVQNKLSFAALDAKVAASLQQAYELAIELGSDEARLYASLIKNTSQTQLSLDRLSSLQAQLEVRIAVMTNRRVAEGLAVDAQDLRP